MNFLTNSFGKFYICGTPIGNLDDITLRCLKTLKEVDLIAAEDTRHTRKLLNYFNIKSRLISYYEFNKEKKSKIILSHLKEGKNIALVSDAGMPGISDPGYEIINLALKNNIQVIPVPGVSALTTALSISGFNVNQFVFIGFIPKKKKEKEKYFTEIKNDKKTIVFFDSPYRIKETLTILKDILNDRNVVINRELTKRFEETLRGKTSSILEKMQNRNIKGELTVIVEGAIDATSDANQGKILPSTELIAMEKEITQRISEYLEKGYFNKDIVSYIIKEYPVSKNWIYKEIIKINNDKL